MHRSFALLHVCARALCDPGSAQRPISWCASGDGDSTGLHEHPFGKRKVSRSLPWQDSPVWSDRRTSAKQPPTPPQQQLPVSQSLLNSCYLVTQPGSGDLSYLKPGLGSYALAGAEEDLGVGHRALEVNLAHVCTSGSMDAAFGAAQDDEEATAPGPGAGGGAPAAGGGGGGGPARCRPTNIRPIEMNDSACPASTCSGGLHGELLMRGIYAEKGMRGSAPTSPGLLRGDTWRPSDWAGSVAVEPLG